MVKEILITHELILFNFVNFEGTATLKHNYFNDMLNLHLSETRIHMTQNSVYEDSLCLKMHFPLALRFLRETPTIPLIPNVLLFGTVQLKEELLNLSLVLISCTFCSSATRHIFFACVVVCYTRRI